MRADVWLWAARFCKTRAVAATLLRAGKVRVNGAPAKPATQLKVGDTVTWRDPLREREVVVRELLPKRVGAALAQAAYDDHSPALPTRAEWTEQVLAVGLRDRGAGRPTKRERREIDQLRGERRG